jgi:hypothetical protein
MIRKNDWVQIHIDVLKPEERATNIPEDTRHVPLEMWVKGHLQNESAELGDVVTVKTKTGRLVEGTLCALNPSFTHNFGDYIPELDQIEETVKTILFGGADHA